MAADVRHLVHEVKQGLGQTIFLQTVQQDRAASAGRGDQHRRLSGKPRAERHRVIAWHARGDPVMRKQGGGMILNISSLVSKNYLLNLAAHA